jgi:hypothetical protein
MATARDSMWPGGHAVDQQARTHTASDIMSRDYPRRDRRPRAGIVRHRRRIRPVLARLLGYRRFI